MTDHVEKLFSLVGKNRPLKSIAFNHNDDGNFSVWGQKQDNKYIAPQAHVTFIGACEKFYGVIYDSPQ